MGYYFEHVTEDGSVVDYYPGSPGFESLDRSPRSSVSTDSIVDQDSESVLDHYAAAPGSIAPGSVSLSDLLLLLQRQDEDPPEDAELVGIETFALSPVESSTGLKGILLDLLGPYDTIVTQYRYQQGSNQYYTYVNDISPDYPWLASALLFIVLLWALFGVLRRGIWNR